MGINAPNNLDITKFLKKTASPETIKEILETISSYTPDKNEKKYYPIEKLKEAINPQQDGFNIEKLKEINLPITQLLNTMLMIIIRSYGLKFGQYNKLTQAILKAQYKILKNNQTINSYTKKEVEKMVYGNQKFLDLQQALLNGETIKSITFKPKENINFTVNNVIPDEYEVGDDYVYAIDEDGKIYGFHINRVVDYKL